MIEASENLPEMLEVPHAVERLAEVASADSVVGPVQERDGRIAIPLASVSASYGLGMGYGTQEGEDHSESQIGGGGGGGGHGRARPVAVLEMTADDVHVHPVVDATRITIASLVLSGWCVFWITRTIKAFRRR